MLKKILILFIIALALVSCKKPPTYKYPFDKNGVDKIVASYIDNKANAGLAVGTFSDGRAELQYYGYSNLERKDRPSKDTYFEIGSITKTYTAAILADLVREGTIKLNDPVDRYLPFKLPKYHDQSMTLLHLATHTASLPRIPGNLFTYNPFTLPRQKKNPYARYTIKNLYEYFREDFSPKCEYGSEFRYSNLGVSLLGTVLANVEGRDFASQLKDRVLDRLGLEHTKLSLSKEESLNFATPYDYKGKVSTPWDFKATAPAGGLRSTLPDMVKYLEANLGVHSSPINMSLKLTHKTQYKVPEGEKGLAFGLTWMNFDLEYNNLKVTWHNGGTRGFRSFIGFVPETNTGVVVLSNSANNVDEIALKILRMLNGEDVIE